MSAFDSDSSSDSDVFTNMIPVVAGEGLLGFEVSQNQMYKWKHLQQETNDGTFVCHTIIFKKRKFDNEAVYSKLEY